MLSHKQKKALEALTEAKTKKDAAAAAGVEPQTVSRWLKDDEFQAELTRLGDKAFSEASARLQGAMDGAITTLIEKASGFGGYHKGDGIKVRAASLILSNAMKLKETADYADRIEALERATNVHR